VAFGYSWSLLVESSEILIRESRPAYANKARNTAYATRNSA
jgi:hypothetical protein